MGLVVRTSGRDRESQEPLGASERIHEFREETGRDQILDERGNTKQWPEIRIITSMKPFEITDSAKAQIERLLEKNTGKFAVSLAVLGGGCAGFKYDWGFVNKEDIKEGDEMTDWGTGRFVVDETSMLYVAGTKIDWVEETFGSQFEISNPNSTSACGCGESFGI